MKSKKSVLITGASSGIGKACAVHLDKMGFRVFAGVRRKIDQDDLRNAASDRLRAIILDVTDMETVLAAFEFISNESEYPLWGLVNNAGIVISGVLEATPMEDFRRLLDVNVIGLCAVTRTFLPLLRARQGRIVNVGSIASFFAGPGTGAYAASKFAVRAISDSLRIELQPMGMTVSLVAPGAIDTDIWAKERTYKKKLRKNVPTELLDVYKMLISAGEKMVEKTNPILPQEVAHAVAHGLTAKRPRFLYLVGKDAKWAYRALKLPKRLINRLIIKHIQQSAEKS